MTLTNWRSGLKQGNSIRPRVRDRLQRNWEGNGNYNNVGDTLLVKMGMCNTVYNK